MKLNKSNDIFFAKINEFKVNLKPMHPAGSMICGVSTRACFLFVFVSACLAMSLHVSSRCHIYSCLLCWSLWITTLDGSLLWSQHLQFACSVELCGSMLHPPNHPALHTIHRNRFTVGCRLHKFLHWSSFSVMVLVGGCLQGWFLFAGLQWNLPAASSIFAGPPPTFEGTSSQAHRLATGLLINHAWMTGVSPDPLRTYCTFWHPSKILIIFITFYITPTSPSAIHSWTRYNAIKHTHPVTLESALWALHALSVQSPQAFATLIAPLQCDIILFFKEVPSHCT